MSQWAQGHSYLPRYPHGRMATVCRFCPQIVTYFAVDDKPCPKCGRPTELTVVYNHPKWYTSARA